MILTPNSQHTYLYWAPQAPLQELLQYSGWITFVLQDTKISCHAVIKVMENNGK